MFMTPNKIILLTKYKMRGAALPTWGQNGAVLTGANANDNSPFR